MSDATTMKSRLRADLMVAMKDGARSEAKLLRGLIAALDNAEAAPARVESASLVRHAFAAGTAEVPRLTLDAERVEAILMREIEEREAAAAEYARLGQVERAAVLRAEAEIARRYVRE
jgi:uncharacterized protein YqeY